MVRGRLINPIDSQIGLTDPSFGTFYRSQYVIRANGLDADLLADRERLHLNTPRTRELAVLRNALYSASRQEFERLDSDKEKAGRSESLLPLDSREHFREPLSALFVRHEAAISRTSSPFDPSTARIERAQLTATEPMATLDYEQGLFQINVNHPLLKTVQDRLGGGKKAREALRALDLFAVADRLLEGYLYDIGVPDDDIERILSWRDGLLRSMALRYGAAPSDDVVNEVLAASYGGKQEFEDALAKLFALMGFESARDGAAGKKDILVIAPIGEEEYRFTIEAKGAGGAVENDAAEVAAASNHRVVAKAKFAVIVAREFKGFKQRGDRVPAVLGECATQLNEEGKAVVSIATTETLIELFESVQTYHYPLRIIMDVLTPVESPSDKLARVKALRHPMDHFDFRGVLEAMWKWQKESGSGDSVPYRAIWQMGPSKWATADFKVFEQRLFALEALAGGLIRITQNNETGTLHQHPDIIVKHIQEAVEEHASKKSIRNN